MFFKFIFVLQSIRSAAVLPFFYQWQASLFLRICVCICFCIRTCICICLWQFVLSSKWPKLLSLFDFYESTLFPTCPGRPTASANHHLWFTTAIKKQKLVFSWWNKFSGSICFASLSIKSLVFSFLEATSLTAETFYLKKGKSPLSTTRLQDKSCVSTLSLLLSCLSFNQLQGWWPRLVACGSHRLVPASHPPASVRPLLQLPTPPPRIELDTRLFIGR